MINNELDRRYEELSGEFKEKHVDDIHMFKERLVELSLDPKGYDINRFGGKLFELVRSELDPEYKNMRKDSLVGFIVLLIFFLLL